MRQAFVAKNVTKDALRALNYSPAVEAFRSVGFGRKAALLEDLVAEFGRAYRKAFIRVDCSREHGVQFLSQGDTFAAEPEGRTISPHYLSDPEIYRIRRWEVLIAGAGTLAETELYGHCIIADNRLAGKLMCEDTFSLGFHEPEGDTALFTYAFLCTREGTRALRAMSYGTKILRIRRDLLRSLPIPLPDDTTQKRVADLIRTTVTERERYLREVKATRACIEALPEMQEALAMCQERKARCVVWNGDLPTLTAWSYGAAGKALPFLRTYWKSKLDDVLDVGGIFNGPHFARFSCQPPHGVDFCSQRDVFLIRPVGRRIVKPAFDEDKLFVREGCLMVGSHGQLNEGSIFGRVTYVDEDGAKYAYTQDILRMYVVRSQQHVAYAFFSTEVGLRLLRCTAVGTSIPSMHLDLLRALPFPDLPPTLHARVTAHVQSAMQARAAATAAEREAIRIVDEEVLPAWLA